MREQRRVGWLFGVIGLLLTPLGVLVLLRLLNLLDAAMVAPMISGYGIAAVGGILSGAVAERLLHRGRTGLQQLTGLIATTVVSVVTIGYIYIFHMGAPMASIGSTERALQQLLMFTQFLLAQAAAILLLVPRKLSASSANDGAASGVQT